MGTQNQFTVYLGGVVIATAWSLHSANEKLIAAVLLRANERGDFPVDGRIINGIGNIVKSSHFPCFFHSSDTEAV